MAYIDKNIILFRLSVLAEKIFPDYRAHIFCDTRLKEDLNMDAQAFIDFGMGVLRAFKLNVSMSRLEELGSFSSAKSIGEYADGLIKVLESQ